MEFTMEFRIRDIFTLKGNIVNWSNTTQHQSCLLRSKVIVKEPDLFPIRSKSRWFLSEYLLLFQSFPIYTVVSGALCQIYFQLTEKYYNDDLVILQGPDLAFCVHHNLTFFFHNIYHGRSGIPHPLLGTLVCGLLLFSYQSIRSSVSQAIGLLVCSGRDSPIFWSILSSDDLFF